MIVVIGPKNYERYQTTLLFGSPQASNQFQGKFYIQLTLLDPTLYKHPQETYGGIAVNSTYNHHLLLLLLLHPRVLVLQLSRKQAEVLS